jgi:hypothetical protein
VSTFIRVKSSNDFFTGTRKQCFCEYDQKMSSSSPSAARRHSLKVSDAENHLRVLDSFPLHKYIDIAQRLLDCFQTAVDNRNLDEAYVYGHRFAHLVVKCLPQHEEWKHSRPGATSVDAKRKNRLNSQVEKVLSMMEVIVQRMDAEELVKEKEQKKAREIEKEIEKSRLDCQRRREKEQRDALEEERQKFLAEQKEKDVVKKKKDVERSAIAKLLALNAKTKIETAYSSSKKITKKKVSDSSKSEISSKTIEVTATHSKAKKQREGNLISTRQSSSRANVTDIISSGHTSNVQGLPKVKVSRQEREKEANAPVSHPVDILASSPHRSKPANNQETVCDHTPKTKNQISIKTKKNETPVTTHNAVELLRNDGFKQERKETPRADISNISLTTQSSCRVTTIVSEHRPGEIETQLRGSEQSVGDGGATKLDTQLPNCILSPLSSKEQGTIDLLQHNIAAQERRLEEIEETQIPYLLSTAKTRLKENQKKEALKCLAHKKRLEQQVDVIKAAIFNMETQMLMLENAIEDRQVKRALDEAASALSGLQQAVGDPYATSVDLTSMNLALPSVDLVDETDEELMEQLEDWVGPLDKRRKSQLDPEDNACILSLPRVPSITPLPVGSAQEIVKAVLGT